MQRVTKVRLRICTAFLLLLASHSLLRAAEPHSDVIALTHIADGLRQQLGIPASVAVTVVPDNPLAMSVEPLDETKEHFLLSIDATFLSHLDNDDLTAAIAHELGHVWIFTHHPFLQTEAGANQVALKVIPRDSLKSLYVKVWAFKGTTGVVEDVLGPEPVKGPGL